MALDPGPDPDRIIEDFALAHNGTIGADDLDRVLAARGKRILHLSCAKHPRHPVFVAYGSADGGQLALLCTVCIEDPAAESAVPVVIRVAR